MTSPKTEWLDISSAPKGEHILYFPEVFSGRSKLPAMIRVERHPVIFPRRPTHWMALPSPPTPALAGAV